MVEDGQNPSVIVLKRHNLHLILRKLSAHLLPQIHKYPAGIQNGRAHPQNTRGLSLYRSGPGQSFLRISHKKTGVPADRFPRRRQNDTVVRSFQQVQPQMRFQLIHLLHHRSGRYKQFFRRFGKTAALRHTQKRFQMRMVHFATPFGLNYWLILS